MWWFRTVRILYEGAHRQWCHPDSWRRGSHPGICWCAPSSFFRISPLVRPDVQLFSVHDQHRWGGHRSPYHSTLQQPTRNKIEYERITTRNKTAAKNNKNRNRSKWWHVHGLDSIKSNGIWRLSLSGLPLQQLRGLQSWRIQNPCLFHHLWSWPKIWQMRVKNLV